MYVCLHNSVRFIETVKEEATLPGKRALSGYIESANLNRIKNK